MGFINRDIPVTVYEICSKLVTSLQRKPFAELGVGEFASTSRRGHSDVGRAAGHFGAELPSPGDNAKCFGLEAAK